MNLFVIYFIKQKDHWFKIIVFLLEMTESAFSLAQLLKNTEKTVFPRAIWDDARILYPPVKQSAPVSRR